MKKRGSIQRKYVVLVVALVGGALLVSGLASMYRTYLETREALLAIERQHAVSASIRIENFIESIERQIGWLPLPQAVASSNPLERRFDYIKLLKEVKEITEAVYIDAQGREQVRESRIGMSAYGTGKDLSDDPRFKAASAGQTYFGPVIFRKETEPYMAIAVPIKRQFGGGVTAVDVNLKFMWEVIRSIQVGKTGFAYVVDRQGRLIAHPDISLVLQKTDLSALPQVRAALAEDKRATSDERRGVSDARDASGKPVLTAYARIATLGWTVFVEQSAEEAYQPLYASLMRTGGLLVAGLLLSMIAGFVFARRMVEPIRALQAGADAIGAGDLGKRIEVRTGDELEALGERFNEMAAKLAASYAGLERKVEARTQELQETLERQNATTEVLRAISGSPTDTAPVFDAILNRVVALCDATVAGLLLYDGELLRPIAGVNVVPELFEKLRKSELRPAPWNPTLLAALELRTVHATDILDFPEYRSLTGGAMTRDDPWRTVLAVPLLREGALAGVITAWRKEVRPFSEKQIELVSTFADQAVIAIENVRLFNETKEALERQTATAEILQVISGSPTDVQPVFDTIARRAVQLCDSLFANLFRYDGEELHFVASHNVAPEQLAIMGNRYPMRPDLSQVSGRVVLRNAIVRLEDALADWEYDSRFAEVGRWRRMLGVPMTREGRMLGAIVVGWREAGPVSPTHEMLLKTFADQAAIAIENVRLFHEIEEKSRQLEIANKHKSDFLANMSHELRTPLNAIIGFSEVLIDKMFGEVNEKQLDYLNDIHASGRHLLSLINDILDLSKIEAGRMELDLSEVNVPDTLSSALTLVRERAQNHGIELGLEIDPKVGVIQADERKVKQVVLNLLSNAVKFTPDGGAVAMRATLDTDHVAVAVKDTGIGIAPEDQDAVFEEFKQVGRDYTKKAEGTGLGLALTRRIVELHGGRIWLESTPGAGSTFTFTLPLRQEKGTP
ncbi:MAG: ATP-binding protein [Burkholderiales bacterium]|nr:ATP-binding protein [Burkholderiales bacterium]